MMLISGVILASFTSIALAVNFPFEDVQLSEEETENYPAIRFGGPGRNPPKQECKFIPGDEGWPNDAEWNRFNDVLGGVLLKPRPLASACYNSPDYNPRRCDELKRQWGQSSLQ